MTIDNVRTNVMIQRKLLFVFKKRIMYIHNNDIYTINLWKTAVSLFESSSAQFRSNEDLEEPECSNYC